VTDTSPLVPADFDLTVDLDHVLSRLQSGMTLGIGGWGSRRKPMALVHALADSDLEDLTIVSFGGPDVGILCARGKVRKLVFGFVSLDVIPLEPHFRAARQSGRIRELLELDEGMLVQGLRAAAWGVPFLPTRAGLGSGVLDHAPELRTTRCPYTDAELVAVPALKLDVALVHAHRADRHGNVQVLSPDPFFDDLFSAAARETYVSTERLELDDAPLSTHLLDRSTVTGVVHLPGGAGFTECLPDYPRDMALMKAYTATAKTGGLDAFLAENRFGRPA
jgi:glutaconate CoA-transferase subunit A